MHSSSGSNSVLDGTREESLGNVMRSYEGEPVGGDSGSDPEGDDSGSGSPLGTGSPNSPEGARSGDFDSATVPEVGEREEGVGENSDTEPETHEVVLSTSSEGDYHTDSDGGVYDFDSAALRISTVSQDLVRYQHTYSVANCVPPSEPMPKNMKTLKPIDLRYIYLTLRTSLLLLLYKCS